MLLATIYKFTYNILVLDYQRTTLINLYIYTANLLFCNAYLLISAVSSLFPTTNRVLRFFKFK